MLFNLKNLLFNDIPRKIVLLIDLIIVAILFCISYFFVSFISVNFNINNFFVAFLFTISIYTVSNLIFKPYNGAIRQTGLKDILTITMTCFFSLLLIYFVLLGTIHLDFIARSLITNLVFFFYLFHAVSSICILVLARLLFKEFAMHARTRGLPCNNVMIYGAGSSGVITLSALLNDTKEKYKVICFIDDDRRKTNKSINGIKTYSRQRISRDFCRRNDISQVIVSIQNCSKKQLVNITDFLNKLPVVIKIVPPVEKWIDGDLTSNQIQNLKVEDLLGREEINLDAVNIIRELKEKTVLITGAAGSIGSGISKQVIAYGAKRIVLIDQAESPLHELTLKLKGNKIFQEIIPIVASITDRNILEHHMKEFQPDIVYHAAAYKHVPLMEYHPIQAVINNVIGTKNIADLAVKYHVQKFIMVSTDKAVNPSNVMGASKRICELYIQSLFFKLQQEKSDCTKFITTRFGNVLGSNGSVIPLFERQIAEGGPVTVTHRDIIRYFMTIPEACNLVLEASAMGQGGEIYVFDMGKPVKIVDLAKNMIRLSGLEPDIDIEIKEIGLRPGEKLYEELLNDNSVTLPTHNKKIMISKCKGTNYDTLIIQIEALLSACKNLDNLEMVKLMKVIVPEYKSKNSQYVQLDS